MVKAGGICPWDLSGHDAGKRLADICSRVYGEADRRAQRLLPEAEFPVNVPVSLLQVGIAHHIVRPGLFNEMLQKLSHSTDNPNIRQGCVPDPLG